MYFETVAVYDRGPFGAFGYDDQDGASSQPLLGRAMGVGAREEGCHVLVARFDHVRAGGRRCQPAALLLEIAGQPRPDVGVERDHYVPRAPDVGQPRRYNF